MIYFRDDLEQSLELQCNSLRRMVNIEHYLIEDDDGENDDVCHDVTIASTCDESIIRGLQDAELNNGLPTIKLCGDRSMLNCLAEVARVDIYHTRNHRLDSSLDFIRNYKRVLTGDYNEWRLCAVWVNPRVTIFGYTDAKVREMEYLRFRECPFDIELEVPCADEESDNEPEDAYRKLFNMGDGQDKSTRVTIRHNFAEKSAEVWTGKLDGGCDRENLKPGQRMLSVHYDDDGDIVLTRRYHDSGVDDDALLKLLVPKDFGKIFCL